MPIKIISPKDFQVVSNDLYDELNQVYAASDSGSENSDYYNE